MTDDEAIQLLLDLVSTPSITGSEQAAVTLMVETLARQGLETEIDGAGNGIGRSKAGSNRLMFLGHIDTVPGTIAPRVKDGRIFGRGAVDAKGPLAAAMVAAIRCRDVPGIEVVGAVGEEGPSHGARHLAAEPAPAGLIIGEPGGSDAIVLGYKGSMRATVSFSLPAGHSAGKEQTAPDAAVDGWNAIRTVCAGLGSGEAVFDQLIPALLAFQSRSDGMRQEAELSGSFRLPPDLDLANAKAMLAEAISPASIEFGDADPAYRAPRDTKLVASFVRSIRAEQVRPRFKVKTGTSDMNVVAPVWNCPVVAYGPGDSSLDHTPNEHVVIEEYLRGIRVLTRVFGEWGRA